MDSRKIHFGNLKDKNKLKITKSKEENINSEKVWLKSGNTKIGKEILKYKTKVHLKSKKKKVTINKF
jgi:stress response protein YsnF